MTRPIFVRFPCLKIIQSKSDIVDKSHDYSQWNTVLLLTPIISIMVCLNKYWYMYKLTYRVKSVLRAPVPAYCLDTASALSAQTDKETKSDTEETEQTEYLVSCKNTSCEH